AQLQEKNREITDSIAYARRIQNAVLPSFSLIQEHFKDSFILYKPRDIVSGDFYWYSKVGERHVFALADCTGHGVPGAFMSIIGINCLNTLILEKHIVEPELILNELKKGVVSSLNSDAEHTDKKDGMDVALITFTKDIMSFSGANQSVYLLRNQALIQFKGDKQPIGLSEKEENFTSTSFGLQTGDRIILFSDGVVDQFGGAEGKKLKIKEFKNWLLDTSELSLQKQMKELESRLSRFMAGYEQTDDMTLAMIEI
ncbi:MAG: SpoIIE family protein phosphatase, partial [Bacteroidia bacterium]|nr:SpoIIE family protein phosphatase [Bacteroidia bacterium]